VLSGRECERKPMILTEENLWWLLEGEDPSIKYRTLTELVGLDANDPQVQTVQRRIPGNNAVDLLFSAMAEDGSWQYGYRDQMSRYLKFLSATLSYAAELGLTVHDERVARAVRHLFSMQQQDGDFHRHYSCYNGLLLRALNRLGCAEAEETRLLRKLVLRSIRHDGGSHCDMRPRRGRTAPGPHKSCIKGALKSLLAFAEDRELSRTEECDHLAEYFLRRRLIFRSDDPGVPVVNELTKLSFPITYHPALLEPLYALSMLGYATRDELEDAWIILAGKADDDARLSLERSLNWNHLFCGIRGRQSKWLTLYGAIVEKYRYGSPVLARFHDGG